MTKVNRREESAEARMPIGTFAGGGGAGVWVDRLLWGGGKDVTASYVGMANQSILVRLIANT